MVVIPGPVTFLMGSPSGETKRNDDEVRHKVTIGRSFAYSAQTVTVEQYQFYRQQFHDTYTPGKNLGQFPDQPAISINWFMAAEYCNWLSKTEDTPEDQWCYQGQGTASRSNRIA